MIHSGVRIVPALEPLEDRQPSFRLATRATQSAHHPNRTGGLIRLHEPEDRFAFGMVSCGNQAAAFDKISRSSFSLPILAA